MERMDSTYRLRIGVIPFICATDIHKCVTKFIINRRKYLNISTEGNILLTDSNPDDGDA